MKANGEKSLTNDVILMDEARIDDERDVPFVTKDSDP